MLSTVVVAGLFDEALRTTSRTMSETVPSRRRRVAVLLQNMIFTVLCPPLVVTRIAFAITIGGGEASGRPVAGVP